MANPSPYVVTYSFAGFQASNPTLPLPAPALDNELANAAAAVATLVSAMESVRRSDGALNNGIVTFDSLASGLQLTIDPTNGQLVAAAVATAQAAQAAASGSATAAAGSATTAATQAAAAAASAATVNLSLYFAKANNLAGVGNPDTARANLNAAKVDGSDMTGRLGPNAGYTVADWNAVTTSGWFAGNAAANGPPGGVAVLVQAVSFSPLYTQQTAYAFTQVGTASPTSALPYQRYSFDSGGGVLAWSPWGTVGSVPVGSVTWMTGHNPPPGFLKANGSLQSRANFPGLFAYALADNIVSEATWAAGDNGAYSAGDLATTFRIPDLRGEFVRGFDDSRGVDAGRILGSNQADSLKDHTHTYTRGVSANAFAGAAAAALGSSTGDVTGSPSTGAAAETRPRNVSLLACIKY